RQPSDAQINHLLDCEAVREHDRLGRAVAGREQFERAATIGLGAVATTAGLGHGTMSRGRDPAQSPIQRSTASGVRPSLGCFRRTDASAPPAESLPAPKNFFAKTSFTQRLPPLWDRTIFGQVFGRGGMTRISK